MSGILGCRKDGSSSQKKEENGPLGNHMSHVIDINGDGIDEIIWGERAIEADDRT